MIKAIISESIKNHQKVVTKFDNDLIEKAAEIILTALKNGNTLFWCGNGGSAAEATHLSAELVGGMYKNKKPPFKSVCLNVDSSFITAWSNDDSYENIFVRQLEALSSPNDILIALSTSGNSENIIKAASFSQENKLKVISLTGNNGGMLKKYSSVNINVNSDSTQRIQELHLLIGHIICDIVEQLF